jgi:hypothetical protein
VNRLRLALVAVAAACLAFAFSGCASVETVPQRVVVMRVDNGAFYEATVRVNGYLVARVDGNHAATIVFSESNLVDGGCATVNVFFRALDRAVVSSKECVRAGQHFSLTVDPQYHVFLAGWDGR